MKPRGFTLPRISNLNILADKIIVRAPAFLLVLVVLLHIICSFLITHRLTVRQRAGTTSFPADFHF